MHDNKETADYSPSDCVRVQLAHPSDEHGPSDTTQESVYIRIDSSPYVHLLRREKALVRYYLLCAHNFIQRSASLKTDTLGTRRRISLITRDPAAEIGWGRFYSAQWGSPFKLRTLWSSKFFNKLSSCKSRSSGIEAIDS